MTFYTTSQGPAKWETITGSIAASATEDIETFDFDDFLRGSYEISIYNDTEVKYKSLSAHVARSGALVCDTISARLGDSIPVTASFVKFGSDVILRMTNNAAFDVEVALETLKVRR